MNNRLLTITIASLIICFCAHLAVAQGCGSLEYRLIATTKGSTLEKELNELAKQGFRFEKEAQAIGVSTFIVLASRPLGSTPSQRFEYRIFDIGQFAKQKQELSSQGFIYRAAMLSSFLLSPGSMVYLLERDIGAPSSSYEYDVIASSKDKKLQTMLNGANSGGFAPVAISGATILLRRDARNHTAEMGERESLVLEAYKMSTLEKEMNEAAKQGYRFLTSSALNSVLMSRDYKSKDQVHYEYKLVAIRASDKSAGALNELSKQGFVFRSATEVGLTAVMERPLGSGVAGNPVEFKVLETRSEATAQKEIQDACVQGFVPVSMSGGRGNFMILVARSYRDS
ncbi:MAG TPA: hypothetical protein VFY40_13365 [Blastocatellia bacterium]|nr:hypothetical protein [Blastocatellia bacterium]